VALRKEKEVVQEPNFMRGTPPAIVFGAGFLGGLVVGIVLAFMMFAA
jgi:hypothetical protein